MHARFLRQEFLNDDERYLETLSYWLENGSSVTWKTLLDVLGDIETKHTIDDLTDKIFSKLGGAHQVSVQVFLCRVKVLCGVLSGGGKCCSGVMCACICAVSSSQTVAVSGPFRYVTSSAPVVSGGAVATERSPPVCEGELCGTSSLQ